MPSTDKPTVGVRDNSVIFVWWRRLVMVPAGRERARRAPGHPAVLDRRDDYYYDDNDDDQYVRRVFGCLSLFYVAYFAFRRCRIRSVLPLDPLGAAGFTTANRHGTRVRSSGRP